MNYDLFILSFEHIPVLTECPENEMKQFPMRMRDWLFQVMTTLVSIYHH